MALLASAIANKIFEILRDSAEILAACQDLFGRAHKVCLGVTGPEGPPPEDCPVFEVISWTKSRGEGEDKKSFVISLNLYLEDTTVTAAEDEETGVRTLVYRGGASLETLMDLALTAALEALPDLDHEGLLQVYDAVEYFPLFAGILTWNISYPSLGGGYEPTL
ncbi:MAG: hypothetical protein ACYDHF_06355 [Candidatus Cryosericum sp.]